MARSSGYRAKRCNEEEVAELRARLAECSSSQWQKATLIMQEIAKVTGKSIGPSGGKVEPRACKYCHYFGHTRQHCEKRKRDVEASMEAYMLKCKREDERMLRAKEQCEKEAAKPLPYYQRATQEAWFDEWGWPWEKSEER
jgi:hypothetical protein